VLKGGGHHATDQMPEQVTTLLLEHLALSRIAASQRREDAGDDQNDAGNDILPSTVSVPQPAPGAALAATVIQRP
jgi:hypothetical protein